jgi:hypothetical protein
VPLVARALGAGAASRDELLARVEALAARLRSRGAVLKLPPEGPGAVLDAGLAPLIRRGVVGADLRPTAEGRALLDFYAASVPDL